MENEFTYPDYRALLRRYEEARSTLAELSYENPDEAEEKNALKAEVAAMKATYWARLPVYLLARCPICGGAVREAVDTFSLNGLGWRNRQPDGFGWRSGRHYEAECAHVQIVAYGVNLNGVRPDDVNQWVGIGSERPFVMAPLIALDDTYVVMHSLPVGRADHRSDRPYTLTFTTYFTANSTAFQAVTKPFHAERTLLVPGLGDYELRPWVAREKLYWLDRGDAHLPLRGRPVDAFPYGDVEGVIGMWAIHQGRLKILYGPKGQRPRA